MNLIQIGDWSCPRRTGRRDGRLILEVKIPGCRTCASCEKRKRWVEGRLELLGLTEAAGWECEGCLLTLPLSLIPCAEDFIVWHEWLLGLTVRPLVVS